MARPRRRQLLLAVLAAPFVLAGLVLGAAVIFEERFIFFPTRPLSMTPDDLGLEHEELELETADGERIHGYFITPHDASPRAYLLFSHGNGGNVSRRIPLAKSFVDRGLALLLYDYRGYGRSSGRPTEEGVYADAEAAYAALLERAGGPGRIILYGRSLGGGVTWELASRHPEVSGVITDATFTSVPDMVRRRAGFAPAPFMRTQMRNLRRVSELDLPKLLLHGTADELIPFEMAERLRTAARLPVELVPLPGAGHNDTFAVDPELYFGAISSFVDRCVPPT